MIIKKKRRGYRPSKPDPNDCEAAIKDYLQAAKEYTDASRRMAIAEDTIARHCRYYGDISVSFSGYFLKTSYMTITPDQKTRKKIELIKITGVTK